MIDLNIKSNNDFISVDGESYYTKYPLRKINKQLPLKVLTKDDFFHWQKYGYVIVKNAVPKEKAESLFKEACAFQNLDQYDPLTWYPEKIFKTELEEHLYIYGFVEMYQHQLMWDIRQSERIYNAFVDIWDTESLWVTLDRVNVSPPNIGNRSRQKIVREERGFDINLHWDVDTTNPLKPQRVQAILALVDSNEKSGGFQCCPGLFSEYESWVAGQPEDRDPFRPTINKEEFPIVQPELAAGDLLIFNGWLPHGVKENQSKEDIRSVFYISMMPELSRNTELRDSRVSSWQSLSTPCWNRTLIGDQDRHEKLRYGAASLTALGERLLGKQDWVVG